MAQTRQPASRQPASRAPDGLVQRILPPPALCGFLVLLVLAFAASYAVGRGVGPVAPGMHGPGITQGGHGDGGTDMEDDDMGGMNHGGGH
ncbi:MULTISPECIES: hypothetical protein [Streptomyces]|uniref:hypothetical protein n=1 Tax=Streptomyces TaxID=1883 RepID=UPI0004C9398E|nr:MULTISPECIES: hypothetical protein [Streptomyces]MBQ0947370.1 hypothetical protein [Streptomyces sp. RK76]MDX3348347.1 hypothetical protein [Streptomyces sp. ME02-6979A]MDX3397008.1 hypothetical protein [Streptomyces sp. ME01-18h]MDX3406183.1 hypothetical protein [Streptomyces sp. ME02-6977A]